MEHKENLTGENRRGGQRGAGPTTARPEKLLRTAQEQAVYDRWGDRHITDRQTQTD